MATSRATKTLKTRKGEKEAKGKCEGALEHDKKKSALSSLKSIWKEQTLYDHQEIHRARSNPFITQKHHQRGLDVQKSRWEIRIS